MMECGQNDVKIDALDSRVLRYSMAKAGPAQFMVAFKNVRYTRRVHFQISDAMSSEYLFTPLSQWTNCNGHSTLFLHGGWLARWCGQRQHQCVPFLSAHDEFESSHESATENTHTEDNLKVRLSICAQKTRPHSEDTRLQIAITPHALWSAQTSRRLNQDASPPLLLLLSPSIVFCNPVHL